MIKLKEILKENKFAWQRKFGEPLPTIEDTTRRHKGIQKISEKKEMSGNSINIIANYTDKNDHTVARQMLARVVDRKMLKAYESVEELHKHFGHMPKGLSLTRDELDKKLFAQAKKIFSNYTEIMGAF